MTDRARMAAAMLLVGVLGIMWWLMSDESKAEDGMAEIQAAAEALSAWARFANTGDLSMVSESFVVGGPQYEQLRSEIASIEPGPAYTFALTEASVISQGVVRGVVTVSRVGERDQIFNWDIELDREGDRWKLWSVRTTP